MKYLEIIVFLILAQVALTAELLFGLHGLLLAVALMRSEGKTDPKHLALLTLFLMTTLLSDVFRVYPLGLTGLVYCVALCIWQLLKNSSRTRAVVFICLVFLAEFILLIFTGQSRGMPTVFALFAMSGGLWLLYRTFAVAIGLKSQGTKLKLS